MKVHKCEVAKSKMAFEGLQNVCSYSSDIAKFPLFAGLVALHSPFEMVFQKRKRSMSVITRYKTAASPNPGHPKHKVFLK